MEILKKYPKSFQWLFLLIIFFGLCFAIDFREIKKQTKAVVKRLDHQYLNEIKPFDILNPTAENIAKYFFDEIGILINEENVKVKEVLIWETPRSAVTYSE